MTVAAPLFQQFADQLALAQGECVEVPDWEALWAFADALSDDTPVVSPAVFAELQRGDLPDAADPLRSIADRAVGVALAQFGFAETGSLLLIEPSPLDRAVSLLTQHLIIAVRTEDILESLADGFQWLSEQPRAAAYATFITGPSRTADIERSLTIGVQGPRRLTAAILP